MRISIKSKLVENRERGQRIINTLQHSKNRWKDTESDVPQRVGALDWVSAERSLAERGYAVTKAILSERECVELVSLYGDDARFRSHIIMERYRFGVGDYKYFENPLPPTVASLRAAAYPHLAAIANRWNEQLGEDAGSARHPLQLADFLEVCHAGGQNKPTPLMLHYEAGGFNCLHQDLYGEVSFPLQMVILLGQPERDWDGGEFLLVEQQPRAQSKGEVVRANQGQAIIFATRHRPVKGTRGYYRANLRHGVSRVHRGTRFTLGIIFHDAK